MSAIQTRRAATARTAVPSTPKNTDQTMSASDSKDSAAQQRARKREVDRICQRKSRDRTKARIAQLEQMVEMLKDNEDNRRIAGLMEQLAQSQSETERLAKSLADIASLAGAAQGFVGKESLGTVASEGSNKRKRSQGEIPADRVQSSMSPPHQIGLKSEHESPPDSTIQFASRVPKPARQLSHIPPQLQVIVEAEALEDESSPPSTPAAINGLTIGSLFEPEASGSDPISPPNQSCECAQPGMGEIANGKPKNMWRFANEVLRSRPRTKGFIQLGNDELDEDTLVTAVMDGWEEVERTRELTTSWKILKQIDQGIFKGCGNVERMAIMRMMHHLLQV
jgi:hypothetical protein